VVGLCSTSFSKAVEDVKLLPFPNEDVGDEVKSSWPV